MPGHRQYLVLVGTALDHHVDLDRAQPGLLCGSDARKHLRHRKVDVVHAAKHAVVQAVQAHRDPLQPGVLQCARLALQQRTVGGECDVRGVAFDRAQGREFADQDFQVLAQQRFTAGDADLAHAVRQKQRRQAGDLLEAQQGGLRQVGMVAVEHLLGHAITAAEVAAVGDTDAQVAQWPSPGVLQQAAGSVPHFRHNDRARRMSQVDQGNYALGHGGHFA